jgi:hypothetical protein
MAKEPESEATWTPRSQVEYEAFMATRAATDLLEHELEDVTELGLRFLIHAVGDDEAVAVRDRLLSRHGLVFIPEAD